MPELLCSSTDRNTCWIWSFIKLQNVIQSQIHEYMKIIHVNHGMTNYMKVDHWVHFKTSWRGAYIWGEGRAYSLMYFLLSGRWAYKHGTNSSLLLRYFVFLQGRGEWLGMNLKGPWEGYRWQAKPVVSFPPSFARTFSSRERRQGTTQEVAHNFFNIT